MSQKLSRKAIKKRHAKVLAPINSTLTKPMRVYGFIFPDGSVGTLDAYNRGLGPIDADLKDWEEPVGVYTDSGDYYSFVFDNRESRMKKKPTFEIDGQNFFYRLLRFYKMESKVDPKTGNMIPN